MPDGGQGLYQPVFAAPFWPSIAPAGSIVTIDRVCGGIFHITQCVNPPAIGASGSCTINASDFAFAGTSLICSGGIVPCPSQVYSDGINLLFSNAVLVSFMVVVNEGMVLQP